MDTILVELKEVDIYLEDIIITGQTDEEHIQNVKQVLNRLKEFGIRSKSEKFNGS